MLTEFRAVEAYPDLWQVHSNTNVVQENDPKSLFLYFQSHKGSNMTAD